MADGLDGAALIAAERQRQIDVEGYTAEHDAGHAEQLTREAQCYVGLVLRGHHGQYASPELEQLNVPFLWPWDAQYWKPTGDEVRDLAKAGALIAAAIDSELAIRAVSDHA